MGTSEIKNALAVALSKAATEVLTQALKRHGYDLPPLEWHVPLRGAVEKIAGLASDFDYTHDEVREVVAGYAKAFGSAVEDVPAYAGSSYGAAVETRFVLDGMEVTVWGVVERVEESVR